MRRVGLPYRELFKHFRSLVNVRDPSKWEVNHGTFFLKKKYKIISLSRVNWVARYKIPLQRIPLTASTDTHITVVNIHAGNGAGK